MSKNSQEMFSETKKREMAESNCGSSFPESHSLQSWRSVNDLLTSERRANLSQER